jgi:hypothetical protein
MSIGFEGSLRSATKGLASCGASAGEAAWGAFGEVIEYRAVATGRSSNQASHLRRYGTGAHLMCMFRPRLSLTSTRGGGIGMDKLVVSWLEVSKPRSVRMVGSRDGPGAKRL